MFTASEIVVGDDISVFGSVGIIIATVILFIQNRQQSKKVEAVKETLTTPNGGSHVKDQLDRMEAHLERLDLRADRADRTMLRLENKFHSHLLWSNDKSAEVDGRLDDIERRFDDIEGNNG